MPLSASDKNRLTKALGKQLHDDAALCRRIGYNPSIFLGMIYDHGPVEACRRVIMDDVLPTGFARLWELKSLELTAEYTILNGEWIELFDQPVRDRAAQRLRQYGWDKPLPGQSAR